MYSKQGQIYNPNLLRHQVVYYLIAMLDVRIFVRLDNILVRLYSVGSVCTVNLVRFTTIDISEWLH